MKSRLAAGVLFVVSLLWVSEAAAQRGFSGTLAGSQEVPPVAGSGTGTGFAFLDPAETQITVLLEFSGLSAAATAGHIHQAAAGTNGAVVFNLAPPAATSGTVGPLIFPLTAPQVASLKAGLFYFNIHTSTNPGGEIRAQILDSNTYTGSLSGAQEVPPNAATGTGSGAVILSTDATKIAAFLDFSGLTGNATAGHIHRAAAGVSGPVTFNLSPPAASSGSIVPLIFSVTPAQVTDLQTALWYFNLHTTTFPGGEIRGQIATETVPVELLRFTAD